MNQVNYNGKAFAVVGFLFQLGILFAYGFASVFFNYDDIKAKVTSSLPETTSSLTNLTTSNAYSQFLVEYILMSVFTLIGFGLILSYIKVGTWSGMTLTLLIVAVNIQLGLMMQKFWFNVFSNGFKTVEGNEYFPIDLDDRNSASTLFLVLNGQRNILPNVTTFRITLMTSISLLVALTGFIGRIRLFQAFITTIIFNVGWNLAFYCNIHVNLTRSPFISSQSLYNSLLFDDFGTNNIYIFGSFFGFIMLLILSLRPTPPEKSQQNNPINTMSKRSNLLALTGTAFIFATFAMTGRIFPARDILNYNVGFLNIIFALSASVIGTYLTSALLRQGNVGVREALLGTISGGVIVGTTANTYYNVAAPIAIGLFSGIVTGFWYTLVHPKINKSNIVDSHGIFGAFMISSFIGAVAVAPITLRVFSNLQVLMSIDNTTSLINREAAGLQLAYAGIAAGTALVTGLIAALISLIFRNPDEDFNDSGFFQRKDYGLYTPVEGSNNPQRPGMQSAQNLKST